MEEEATSRLIGRAEMQNRLVPHLYVENKGQEGEVAEVLS